MGGIKDLAGERFGRLVAKAAIRESGKRTLWTCLCDCGNETKTSVSQLTTGKTRSCGCLFRETKSRRTHGRSKTTEYKVWAGMLRRCNNPHETAYPRYGGRGIRVCERWVSFENFYADMGERPGNDYQLDRIDNGGNYEPGNVRWTSRTDNCNNRSDNIRIEHAGRSLTLAEWARELGMSQFAVAARLRRGWTAGEMAEKPPNSYRVETKWMGPISALGKTLTVHEWSERVGVKVSTIKSRVDLYGWSIEQALSTPARRLNRRDRQAA